ncbi:MAG: hypothetical protein EHM55_13130 [Acidobacteria bacterium]|nr:MAG: hypothetical protein EHM55_13130 [Acidobacteriota bacterium]
MSTPVTVVPLLVFEAADCLMAVVACEVGHLEKRFRDPFSDVAGENGSRNHFDLGEYFAGRESDGPWLQWARGSRRAWLRVRRVVDVVPVSIKGLTPMPAPLRAQARTCAFLAAGVSGDDVFLLLDPARLVH